MGQKTATEAFLADALPVETFLEEAFLAEGASWRERERIYSRLKTVKLFY